MYEAEDEEEFISLRETITLDDYEFVYRARSSVDFQDDDLYLSLAGDIDNYRCSNPDDDDEDLLLGSKVEMTEVWQYISVVFIDALRDVSTELKKSNNPIKKLMSNIRADIDDNNIEVIKSIIRDLNTTISSIEQIGNVGLEINQTLKDTTGYIYSSNVILESRLKDDFDSISRFITINSEHDDINSLGLGHLNVIYMALKLVEFRYIRNREILNIMIVEEPEAHVHVHIQKTLFDNMKNKDPYIQVIMTSHSTHISEVSDIQRMNILKSDNKNTEVMYPSRNLEEYGKSLFQIKRNVSLIESVQRYLDAKRTTLLFAKGVILVEGDGEEILIPNLVRNALGISLDEIGVSIVNIGSVSFEYIASLFNVDRIRRRCAIVTDLDCQIEGANINSQSAQVKGRERKRKFDDLFSDNIYVDCFYANYTLEIEFAKENINQKYIKKVVENIYDDQSAINRHCKALSGNDVDRYNSIITILDRVKKGWYAILISNKLDSEVAIPDYILQAIIFASDRTFTNNWSLQLKMIKHICKTNENINTPSRFFEESNTAITEDELIEYIDSFKNLNPDLSVSKLLSQVQGG